MELFTALFARMFISADVRSTHVLAITRDGIVLLSAFDAFVRFPRAVHASDMGSKIFRGLKQFSALLTRKRQLGVVGFYVKP